MKREWKAGDPGDPMRSARVRWSRWKAHSHVAIWLAAAAAGILLFVYGARTGGMTGYVEIVEHPIASIEIGRLQSVDVAVGSRVSAGQVVARLDAAAIDAEIGAAQALLADMESTIPATVQVAFQWQRQFAAAIADAAAAYEEHRRLQSQDEAELQVVNEEIHRLQPLLDKRLIDASVVNELRTRQAVLRKSVALYPEATATLHQRMLDTRQQHEGATRQFSKALGMASATNYQAEAQAMTLAMLQARRREYVLRSPAEGVVSQILLRPGDVIPAGLPVLIVIESPAKRVVGFMPEANSHDASEGQQVWVERMYGLGTMYRATLSAMEPAVRGLPGQVNPVPNRVMRGRRIYCNLDESTDFLPGETVQVRLQAPFWISLERGYRWLLRQR